MEREQAGKDMDAARDEGGKEADHDRAKELNKQKESVNGRMQDTLAKLRRKIITEAGTSKSRLDSVERIINRNGKNQQKNG